jgi:hypothetical protein
MKTLKSFVEETHLPERVVRGVVRQMGGWASFKESAEDVAAHGATAGWCGFTYYSDTVRFAKRHQCDLTAMANEMARDLGESSGFTLIAGFNCLKSYSADEVFDALMDPRSDARTDVFNALAWFALEEVARSFSDLNEGE